MPGCEPRLTKNSKGNPARKGAAGTRNRYDRHHPHGAAIAPHSRILKAWPSIWQGSSFGNPVGAIMAKAIFHKHQRVYIKPVGTWSIVERVVPHWVKDVSEPLRVTYDVGLGREFTGAELVSEASMHQRDGTGADDEAETWRVFRVKNRWQAGDEAGHHPHPGTFPVVMTDEFDWGGWRVPGAEYDRNPAKIEYQARLISNAPHMLRILRAFVELAGQHRDDIPGELLDEARRAGAILRHVYDVPGELRAAGSPAAA